MDELEITKRRLAREIAAREDAERLLEEKSSELFDAKEAQEKALRKLYRSQRMEAVGRMSSVVVHDFNNIIAGIQGFATFLHDDLTDEQLKGYAERIITASNQATALVKQIANYGKKQGVAFAPIILRDLIKDSLEIFSMSLKDNINIGLHINADNIAVDGNNVQLMEVITNILANARDAYGNDEGSIDIAAEKLEGYNFMHKPTDLADGFDSNQLNIICCGREMFPENIARIRITDHAGGIDKKTISNIFRPYFSTKDKDKGTGLGLFGAEGIISTHGGGMRFISQEGGGTIAEIILPLEAQEITITPKKKLYILVVDDDKLVGQMLCTHLERMGHNAGNVSSAAEALSIIKSSSNAWDLVITDEIMPKTRGSELLDIIKQEFAHIMVIIYSGFSEHINKETAIQRGAVGFWDKPLDMNIIEQEIGKLTAS